MRHIDVKIEGELPAEGMLGIVIATEGEISIVNPENGNDYQLQQMRGIVDGSIEIVHLNDVHIEGLGYNLIMVINEEGLFTCEPNLSATGIWQHSWIHGDVLITQSKRVK
jgi:hypothetical protein